MKKHLTVCILWLLIFTQSIFSQTKADTQVWLKLQLNKYFSTNTFYNAWSHGYFDGWNDKYFSYKKGIAGEEWVYSDDFWFKNSLLCNTYTTTTRLYYDKSNQHTKDTITQNILTTFNLQRLQNIDIETSRDTMNGKNKFTLRLHLHFKNETFTEPHMIEKYDLLTNKITTLDAPGQKTFIMDEYLICNNPLILEDNMPKRIVKALEHLATLNGARILDNIF